MRGAESSVDAKPNLTGPSCREQPGLGRVALYPDRVVWTPLPNMLVLSSAVAFFHVANTALHQQLLSRSSNPLPDWLLAA